MAADRRGLVVRQVDDALEAGQVLIRLRICQRQSFQSRALASGKKRLRKSWLRGLMGNRSRAVGRLIIGAKKGGFAALGVILGERACRS